VETVAHPRNRPACAVPRKDTICAVPLKAAAIEFLSRSQNDDDTPVMDN
jgi:hypothetical protein